MPSTPLKPKLGGHVLLFDRLTDENPFTESESVCHLVLGRDEVFASVKRELARLFNTRSNLPLSQWENHSLSVVNYGLPDYMHLSVRDGSHRKQMARMVTRAINAFEPRLRHIHLTPIPHDDSTLKTFRFRMTGKLVIGEVTEPISCPISL